ncbi:ead/Ea22-like family protein [Crenobacter cavernae]|uniref:Ead/Ea22-like family protein n=1 Tax=Crenobacter cavernae TaxID=2290923 RepID=A0ABY0FE75_9NEIS|nr:ead/Ea22-like family protein [Crenobacter cavernae]RXZ42654.1 ead/Ea22-like family protein [Crenobacter cavernae]
MTITNEKLQELRTLAEAATPGPWSSDKAIPARGFCAQVWDLHGRALVTHDSVSERASVDCAYIAAANPATILALLDELALRDERIAELEQDRATLANAIRNASVKIGICREDVALTGPHLLMLTDEIVRNLDAARLQGFEAAREMAAKALETLNRKSHAVDGEAFYLALGQGAAAIRAIQPPAEWELCGAAPHNSAAIPGAAPGIAEVIARVQSIVASEPELTDEPSAELLAFLKSACASQDIDALMHTLRITVRETKDCIAERIAAEWGDPLKVESAAMIPGWLAAESPKPLIPADQITEHGTYWCYRKGVAPFLMDIRHPGALLYGLADCHFEGPLRPSYLAPPSIAAKISSPTEADWPNPDGFPATEVMR